MTARNPHAKWRRDLVTSWDREQAIELAGEWMREHCDVSRQSYRSSGHRPSVGAMTHLFGSWSNAVRVIKSQPENEVLRLLPPRRRPLHPFVHPSLRWNVLQDEPIRQALRRFLDTYGGVESLDEYDLLASDDPCYPPVAVLREWLATQKVQLQGKPHVAAPRLSVRPRDWSLAKGSKLLAGGGNRLPSSPRVHPSPASTGDQATKPRRELARSCS